jgi:hypothetical protein
MMTQIEFETRVRGKSENQLFAFVRNHRKEVAEQIFCDYFTLNYFYTQEETKRIYNLLTGEWPRL